MSVFPVPDGFPKAALGRKPSFQPMEGAAVSSATRTFKQVAANACFEPKTDFQQLGMAVFVS